MVGKPRFVSPSRSPFPILERIHQHLSRATEPEWLTIWAIASTAFFGCFRLGELLPASAKVFDPATHLTWGDVSIDSHTDPTMVQVNLKKSKCDQFGKGADIVIGHTGKSSCPVLALLNFTDMRRNLPAGPIFLDTRGQPITEPWFTEKIRAYLQALGLPQNDFAGHSFRMGAATSAALA